MLSSQKLSSEVSLKAMANALRFLAIDGVQKANSGHPGMPMGMADVATVLFTQFLKFNPGDPIWPDRDRFVLSAGHGSMLLYGLLYLSGYQDMTVDELKRFRQMGAKTAGHPEYGHATGIETTTGPLGQGLTNAVGMALAEKILAAQFGGDLMNHKTYTIVGDGCLMEGISHEAISMAGHLGLNNLIVLFDDNGISIDGPTDLTVSDDQVARFKASGWDAMVIDGHDVAAIEGALTWAQNREKPILIACKTTIGFGSPNKAGTSATHGSPLGDEEIQKTREALGWTSSPFEVPSTILNEWRQRGERSQSTYEEWQKNLSTHPQKDEFLRRIEGKLPQDWPHKVQNYLAQMTTEKPALATRQSSQNALDVLVPALPELLGGSADLTGSNNTRAKGMVPITPTNFMGNYVYYGVREHAMAAAMNGIALHGGFIPYGGTFLVFTDYCRPAMRLAALMGQRVIYVMTHDSIGLGEDGPTHQPVEHLASLRAIPNLYVFRPCDAVETMECWQAAIELTHAPSVLALTRQKLAPARVTSSSENLCQKGGYVLREVSGTPHVTLIATGSEVEIALAAADILATQNKHARVVSMPCVELFEAQDAVYKKSVLGTTQRIIIEAGIRQSWDRYMREGDVFIGMTGFGASAPAEELYQHFGITADAVVNAVEV